MTVNFSRVEGPGPMRAVPEPSPNGANGARGADFASDLASASAIPSPPPEVSAEVRDAARAATRLHELGRELRFERSDEGGIRVELRDREGNLIRPVPTTEIFDFAAGRVTS
jgi:hypothetical protein